MTNPKTENPKRRLGVWGETIALDYLQNQGMTLVAKNFRTPDGEMDLIMQRGETLIFVEVKTRSNTRQGFPEEAVTDEKLDHLAATASWFLEGHPEFEKDWRLDVVSIIGKPGETNPQVEWFENVG